MRFFIETPKKRIASDDFRGHADDIEMSGERCSVIVRYGADENNLYFAEKKRGIRSVGGCSTPARLGALDTEFTKKSQLLPCKPSNADV